MKKRGFFTKRTVSNMIVVGFGVLLYIILSNFQAVTGTFGWIWGILYPFVLGIGLAYLINMPMRFFERKVFHKTKRCRLWSLITVYALVIVGFFAILGLMLPQVGQSLYTLASNLDDYLNNFEEFLGWLTAKLSLEPGTLNFIAVSSGDIIDQLIVWISNASPEIFNAAKSVGSSIVAVVTAFIASLYMLASRDRLVLQTRRVLYAALPEKRADELYRIGHLSDKVFSGFISGKLLDSLIIGVVCYVFMTIMNLFIIEMPYALLISVVVGITNIIPFFGPFIGAIPSALIIFFVNPWSAIWFVVFIIVLQQIDGNIIGPKILGGSTGLPALWVLISIVVGGGMFGFMGMILGVPTVAVLYTLASDFIAKRLRKKDIPPDPATKTSPGGGEPGGLSETPDTRVGGDLVPSAMPVDPAPEEKG